MSHSKTAGSRTLDHIGPTEAEAAGQRPALVAVLPPTLALPIPPAFAPAGRKWFAVHGIADREMSTGHCHFLTRDDRLMVRDAGSRNGTWLDGRRLVRAEEAPLYDGSVLRIGRTVFVYRERLEGPAQPSEPLGELVAPFGLRRLSATLAAADRQRPATLLIEGETGTGKELMAHHLASELGRRAPFVAVNVTAIAGGVFESHLFGHVAGAFSDARSPARGIIAAHEGGTVFLDEIGELPLTLQPKLLRVIENREVLPVGAERPVGVDVLLIVATNRNLGELVERGAFRRDLFARLDAARLRMPALRDHREDIVAVAQAHAPRYDVDLASEHTEIEAIERLLLEPWPTNVRGLVSTLARLGAIDPGGGLRLWALERALGSAAPQTEKAPVAAELTQAAVQEALRAADGNETQAARRLGVSRGKLRRFLQRA